MPDLLSVIAMKISDLPSVIARPLAAVAIRFLAFPHRGKAFWLLPREKALRPPHRGVIARSDSDVAIRFLCCFTSRHCPFGESGGVKKAPYEEHLAFS